MTLLKGRVRLTSLLFVVSIFLSACGDGSTQANSSNGESIQGLARVVDAVIPGNTAFEIQISSSTDDAEEYTNGTVKFTSSDLELADSDESNAQIIGMRFNQLDLPAGAIISSAYIQFQVDETGNGASALTITGEANDNPATYSSATNNITNRPQTAASANWNPADWAIVGSNGIDQQTSDLSAIVQELVNRSGWNSGQSMAFMITGTGTRTAESFNGSPAGAPILHIEYSTDGNPAPVASFTATPTTGNAPLDVSFDATASTDDSAIASYDWAFGDGTSATGITANHTYTPGTYTATLTVTDDAGKTNSSSQTITVIDPNAPTALDIQVSSSSDDAEEYANGTVNTDSSDLELTQDSSSQTIGIRFNSIALPTDAVISSAYLQFQVDEATTAATQLTVYGEANANPAGFNTTANSITNRALTNANSAWIPDAWPNTNEQGAAQRSTDLSAIVQELVSQSGWNSGQSMVFIIDGTGKRTAESFDGSPTGAPILHIEYSTDGNPAPVASFTATPTTGNAPLDVSFDGTASSDDNAIASYDWDFGDGTSATGSTANHTYTPGTYTATLTVTDDAGKTNSSSQTITVIDPNAPTALDIQVSSSSDDAEEYANGTVNTDSSDLELTQDSSSQTIGMRFNGIALPADAIISSAYLQFQVDEATTAATQLTIYGEANANPASFNTTANNITNRTVTTASSAWTPTPWSNVNEQGAAQRSTDISAIVQELVSQSGWNSGQSMVFIIDGTGKRTAESFDGSPAGAPILHIEYSTDGNPAPVASFTATPTTGNAPLDVSFDGTASSDDNAIASYDWDFGDGTSATGSTANHTYTPGTYTATLTVTDDAGKTNSSSQTITVIDPNAPTAIDIPVSSPSDDAEQRSDGSMYLDSSDLELVTDGGIQQVGVRFNNLSLPRGSIITNAYIQFQVDETSNGATILTIQGEANNNPTTFTSTDNNISDRPLSSASATWSPAPWNSPNVKGADQQTTDLSNIVQELIDRAGWNSGQSMAFILTGSGSRTAESYEGSTDGAATLHIEYTHDGNPPPDAQFTATPTSGDVALEVSFDGSASSDNTAIVDYAWDFGDGTTVSTSTPTTSHTYTIAGNYTVSLTVTDEGDKTDTSTQTNIITATTPAEVVINEILAKNETGLMDGNGLRHDWIELRNQGGAADISGWCLTDKEAEPQQWCFPANTSLAAGAYLIVYASKLSAPEITEGEYHAQLKLGTGGEYLALLKPNGDVVDSHTPSFPQQIADVSYGRDSTDALRYFATPTPNAVNGAGLVDLLIFDTDTINVTDTTTTQVSLSTASDSNIAYDALTSNASWLTADTANGEDGATLDLIDINVDITGLADGVYTGTVTATAANHLEATVTVTLTVGTITEANVIINEILAKNTSGLADGNGLLHDWIELYNQGGTDADISGWCLSDKQAEPQQWCFPPETNLAAGAYLIVYASKLSAPDITEGEYHAQLSLKTSGEYLALLKADGTIVDSFDPSFPQQLADVSYGRNNSGILRYFPAPTPNAANGAGVADFLTFDPETLAVTDSSTTQVTLSTGSGSAVAYTILNQDDWLIGTMSTGEDGLTNDLIDIVTNPAGLEDGVYTGTVIAIANDHLEATITVTMTVGDIPEAGVVINEILASNLTGLTDGNGLRHDWIELYNGGSTVADISGWCLTDKESEPQQWCFPADTSLAAGAYLIVYASKLSAPDITPGEYHAQLKLKSSGEYLALLKPDGSFVDGLVPTFPQQAGDISYSQDDAGVSQYFGTPTPNAANGESQPDLLFFDTDLLELTGSTTTQVSLSAASTNSTAYTLSSDVDWLSASAATGEDGTTTDLIDVVTDVTGLAAGDYTGVITAIATNHESAKLTVTVSVQSEPITGTEPWKELNVKFNGIGMGVDKNASRLFYPLGAGFSPAASLIIELDYLNAPGFKIGINGSAALDRGTSYDFGDITYGSDATIQIYKDGAVTSTYTLVLTSTPVIEIEAEEIVDEPKLPGIFRFLSYEADQDSGELFMGIETRGQSSQWYDKKPYAIEFTEAVYPSATSKVTFMDMRKDDDWIMDPAYRDLTFVRNLVAADIARDVQPYAYKDSEGVEHGENSIHGYLTEVIQNGEYQGIYVLEERIDRKQLGLSKITVPVDQNGEDDWTQVDFNDPENGSVLYKATSNNAGLTRTDIEDVMFDFEQKYPKESDVVHYGPLQSLIQFIVESSDQEFIDGIGDIIDIDSVVDFWLVTAATQSTDTSKKNYYLAKSGAGKFKIYIWDFDASFGMWWHGGRNNGRHAWNSLLNNNELLTRLLELPETGFNTKLKARWTELRPTAFSKQSMYQHFVDYDAILQPAGTTDTPKSRNMIRWPNSGAQEGIGGTEHGELPYISDFLDERLPWLDDKIANLPE